MTQPPAPVWCSRCQTHMAMPKPTPLCPVCLDVDRRLQESQR